MPPAQNQVKFVTKLHVTFLVTEEDFTLKMFQNFEH